MDRGSLYIEDGDWRLVALAGEILFVNEYGEIRDFDGFPVKTSTTRIGGEVLVHVVGGMTRAWRLVAEAFLDTNIRGLLGVSYLDGNPENLRVDNLMYKVSTDGVNERWLYPRIEYQGNKRLYILDGRSGRPLRDLDSGQVYANTHAAARALNTHQQNVYAVVRGERRTVAGRRLSYLD